jgi:hypothetical protein
MVTTAIEKRVAQLEESAGGGGRCPECGLGPDDDKRPPVVEFVDPGEDTPDEWCPACGRALCITIGWDDSEEA